MVDVSFYINHSDNREVNKNLTLLKSTTATLKQDTSTVSPAIIVPNDTELYSCNYIYIDVFKRYYYVSDIRLSKQLMHVYTSESDVLMSFKAHILDLTATLERQSMLFNTYLDDSEMLTYSNALVTTREFPNVMRISESLVMTVTGGTEER